MPADVTEQYDSIYRYCYFKLKNRETAEDVTQETFLRYFEHYACDSTEQALKCLYTIARNLCVDEYRRVDVLPLPQQIWEEGRVAGISGNAGVEQMFVGAAAGENTAEKVFAGAAAEVAGMRGEMITGMAEQAGAAENQILDGIAVKRALAVLAAEEAELLLLRYVNELPVSVLAGMFGVSRFSVRRKLLAASKKFKKELRKEGFYETEMEG